MTYSLDIADYRMAEIVVCEVVSGVFMVLEGKLTGLNDGSYIDSITLKNLLNKNKVIIEQDGKALHHNFKR